MTLFNLKLGTSALIFKKIIMHRAKKVSKSGKTKDQGDATLKSIHFIKILTRLTDKKTHNIFRLTNQARLNIPPY